MPELPEVETVRDGLQRFLAGRTIGEVQIRHPRSVRRHVAGEADLIGQLVGRRVEHVSRRGKYLWLVLADPELRADGSDGSAGGAGEPPTHALVGHLGMSGQLLVADPGVAEPKHLHVRVRFDDDGPELRFVDQRTFGGVQVEELVPDGAGGYVPAAVAHIARDPLDPQFDDAAFLARLRRRDSAVKRALLDQSLISGIGNIYADESLWRARVHPERLARRLPRPRAAELLTQVRAVLSDAIRAGGTSFDALYVNVNGESGYFDRSLAAYGRAGEPCPRCGAPIRRMAFMNRSSYFCPRCQRLHGASTSV